MNMIRVVRYPAAGAIGLALVLMSQVQAQIPGIDQNTAQRRPDVIYVPTSPEVVDAMLKMANVGQNDVVYDLGCGDGRIVVAAARAYGARATGVDIDPQRIAEANANARTAGVEGRVKFILGDLFEQDLHDATVVTLYLLNTLNLKLRPKLWKELKPGTRVVSHAFDMGDWQPEQKQDVGGTTIYLWRIPAHPPSE
jgi:SAM-dependent methyltransferase